ncbi:MAG: DUF2057 family protein [Bermanella sp.]
MRLFFLFALVIVQGCSTAKQVRLYDGPAIGQDKEVQIVLPLSFELISLNEQPVAQFSQTFRNHDLTVKLPPGQHTLVMRYSDIWQIDADNHETLSTGQMTFTGELNSGELFTIKTPLINTLAQAKQFVKQPEVSLVSAKQTITGSHVAKADPLTFKQDENIEKVAYPHLKQLKFWWQKASEYEKQQFQQWLSATP